MPEELLDLDTFKRLKSAVEYSRRELRPFREKRMEAMAQYVGMHYSNNASSVRVPMNLIEMACNIYIRYLAGRSPHVMVSTAESFLKASASDLELALNRINSDIDIEFSYRMAVLDSFFGLGIIKVGIDTGGYYEHENEEYDVETPFADFVSLDDWVHDTSAKVRRQCGFEGNRYRLPYEDVMESDLYDKKALDQLQPTDLDDAEGEEREEELSQNGNSPIDGDEFEDRVELIDLFLPRHKLLVTAAAHGEVDRPLRVVRWTGPRNGPFHVLSFSDVPGQIMPLAPAHLWLDLHELANRLMRKLGRQAERHKTILGYRGGAADDAQRIVQAEDGETIRMDQPGEAREYTFGGPDQRNLAFTMLVKDLFSYQNGGLDTLGGLGASAGTLGQEELISSTASKRVQDMQGRVHTFMTGIQRSIASYVWTNPYLDVPVVKKHHSGLASVPFNYGPQHRRGSLPDYRINIQPYSFAAQTPESKLQTVTMFWERFVVPYLQMYAQQGVQVSIKRMAQIVGKLSNFDELEEILLMYGAGQNQQGGPSAQQPRQSPVTRRENIRINRSQATQQGQGAQMIQALMGKGMASANG